MNSPCCVCGKLTEGTLSVAITDPASAFRGNKLGVVSAFLLYVCQTHRAGLLKQLSELPMKMQAQGHRLAKEEGRVEP